MPRGSSVFGKSLVGGTATSDIFDGVVPGPIPYARSRSYEAPEQRVGFELGGPWAFYHEFWRAHNIEHLADLYSPEAQVAPGEFLWVPLIIRNDTDSPKQVALRANLPAGWTQQPTATIYPVAAHDSYPIQLTIKSPESQKGNWQTLSWTASSDGKSLGTVTLRVAVVGNYLPQ